MCWQDKSSCKFQSVAFILSGLSDMQDKIHSIKQTLKRPKQESLIGYLHVV